MPRRWPFLLLFAAALPDYAAMARRTVVVSDTHFGVGANHRIEDFRWTAEWTAFLAYLRKARVPTDLVLNGDTAELWQSLQNDCHTSDQTAGCTESEALQRLRVVLAAHAAELRALRDFADDGDNRLYVVPGNHDAALLFPLAGRALVEAIGAKNGRVTLLTQGYWRSADDLIIAAHGHQADPANRFSHWPNVIRESDRRLERPWGEQFVQSFYSDVEGRYEIIDNIRSEADAIRMGIAAEGFRGTMYEAGRLAAFLLTNSTVRQSSAVLGSSSKETGSNDRDEWDFKAIRYSGAEFFLDSVAKDDPAREAIAAAIASGAFRNGLCEMTDAEIREICDERAALRERQDSFTLCPQSTRGELVKQRMRSNEALLAEHLADLDRLPPQGMFALAVLSHTHDAHPPHKVSLERGDVQVVNTGAWQRVVASETLADFFASHGMKEKQGLSTVSLDRLPACYSFVVIAPYKDTPEAKLRYWDGKVERDDCLMVIREK
jgi:UDP-2,3-diacylglucosamine pyrophosphatase LpxH